jgi:hypothetical protein
MLFSVLLAAVKDSQANPQISRGSSLMSVHARGTGSSGPSATTVASASIPASALSATVPTPFAGTSIFISTFCTFAVPCEKQGADGPRGFRRLVAQYALDRLLESLRYSMLVEVLLSIALHIAVAQDALDHLLEDLCQAMLVEALVGAA